jgi:hypothetical protein
MILAFSRSRKVFSASNLAGAREFTTYYLFGPVGSAQQQIDNGVYRFTAVK